jgi:hypothetical protein
LADRYVAMTQGAEPACAKCGKPIVLLLLWRTLNGLTARHLKRDCCYKCQARLNQSAHKKGNNNFGTWPGVPITHIEQGVSRMAPRLYVPYE